MHSLGSSYTDASPGAVLSHTTLTPPLPEGEGDLLPLGLSQAAWGWSERVLGLGARSQARPRGRSECRPKLGYLWVLFSAD